MFAVCLLSACTVHRLLQQRVLSARLPLLWLSLTMQHKERRRLCCTEQQSWIQEWQNVVFSDEFRFYMLYSDGCLRVWKLQGDRTLPAFVRYRHRGPEPSVMDWAAIGYKTRTSLTMTEGNFNIALYIFDILCPVIVPCLKGLPNAIFRRDNTRP